ncbi:caffeic acid 3-O-methyltransferase-like [Macadamia integrifolia]|uniref:caffeic acid 3-O-methyltransferase-like n=1 Tax=Macadamia integrifolia TaxID=60698 RepID=UPI001C5008FC|nr:caffeic acid 3-O-methyltransferase-like [Macadamia integrifolia]
MPSTPNQTDRLDEEEEECCLFALQLATGSLVHMVFKAILELNLVDIMEAAGPGKQFSPLEIAALLPIKNNPDAPEMLDRMLRLLASYSIFTSSQITGDDGRVQRFYGLGPPCRFFVTNEDGASLSPLLRLMQDKVYMESWYHLKDAVLEGGIPFNKAHGIQIYDYFGRDPRFNKVFNDAMFIPTITLMKVLLEVYEGFEGANVVVDVGGGVGKNLDLITYKYPTIKGINFDLPHVIADAPPYPGRVDHVAGDMFLSIPKGDIIFMKTILHNWSDEHCLSILKNCYEALPENGKVIVFETILPETPETNLMAKDTFAMDLLMMTQHTGGKERTEKEYKALANGAGFRGAKLAFHIVTYSILEFYK